MTSAKKYHCCIPGCKTYDYLDQFVALPYEPYWREQWIFTIPRNDWVVEASTIACKSHFTEPINASTKSISNGNKKKRFTFVSIESVPTVISQPQTIPTLDNICTDPQYMFELFARDIQGPKTLGGLGNSNSDFIGSYFFLKALYPAKLKMFLDKPWKVVVYVDHIIFFTTDFSETPRIPASIKVDKCLIVNVSLAGRTMDPRDLTWALPMSRKLNRWSQLQIMLSIYGR